MYFSYLTWYCINSDRPASLFMSADVNPVSSSSDRADVRLQGYHKNYSQQQLFSPQQGSDNVHWTSSTSAASYQFWRVPPVFWLVLDMHFFLCASPRLFVWRRKSSSTSQRWRLWSHWLFHKLFQLSLCRYSKRFLITQFLQKNNPFESNLLKFITL